MVCQAVRGWAPADVGATMTEVAVSSAVTPLRALRVYSTLTSVMRLADAAVWCCEMSIDATDGSMLKCGRAQMLASSFVLQRRVDLRSLSERKGPRALPTHCRMMALLVRPSRPACNVLDVQHCKAEDTIRCSASCPLSKTFDTAVRLRVLGLRWPRIAQRRLQRYFPACMSWLLISDIGTLPAQPCLFFWTPMIAGNCGDSVNFVYCSRPSGSK